MKKPNNDVDSNKLVMQSEVAYPTVPLRPEVDRGLFGLKMTGQQRKIERAHDTFEIAVLESLTEVAVAAAKDMSEANIKANRNKVEATLEDDLGKVNLVRMSGRMKEAAGIIEETEINIAAAEASDWPKETRNKYVENLIKMRDEQLFLLEKREVRTGYLRG